MKLAFTREALKRAQWLPGDIYVVLLGSNLQQPEVQLEKARHHLAAAFGTIHNSALYKTAPWGFESADYFLNQAILFQSNCPANQVLAILKKIEANMGRKKSNIKGYESRIIDLDILFWGSVSYQESGLIIPHPLIQERKFATAPLNEVLPDYIHPVLDVKISNLNRGLTDFVERLS